jgi:hypothetical protein
MDNKKIIYEEKGSINQDPSKRKHVHLLNILTFPNKTLETKIEGECILGNTM